MGVREVTVRARFVTLVVAHRRAVGPVGTVVHVAAGATDDDSGYATSDAAWMTEEAEADRAERAVDDTADISDTGDTDAFDRPAGDGMTEDTTEPVADEVGRNGVDTLAAAAAPSTTAAPRTAKGTRAPRAKKRASRPQGSAATTGRAAADGDADTVPPVRDDAAADGARADEAAATTGTTTKKRAPRQVSSKRPATPQQPVVLRAEGLVKRYGQTLAADQVDLEIRQGSIFGVVGPNGAGKTTTLSMLTGLLRPDAGTATVLDHDVWADPTAAKRSMGVLPDRLRLFDRLTGAQLLYYSATLRGLDGKTARARSTDLAEAFGLGEALGRQVADYSVGMAKKIALAATLIHSPRVLVLDEPFESVDPVSAATITDILRRYTQGGGTVVLSSHSMELVQRTCDSVAVIVGGKVLASGTMAQVRGRKSLEDKFVELAGGRVVAESMEWLHSFSG